MSNPPAARRATRAQRSRLAAFAPRLTRLASPDGRRFLHGLSLLLEVELRLRLLGFARVHAALQRLPGPPDAEEQWQIGLRGAQSMAQAIHRAARYVPRAHCLHRALALLLWLRRRSAAAVLRIGVRPAGAAVEGHAWVEWRGIILDDDPLVCDTFTPLEPHEATPWPNGWSAKGEA